MSTSTLFESVVKAAAEREGFEPAYGDVGYIERDYTTGGYYVHLYDPVVDHHAKFYVSQRDLALAKTGPEPFARSIWYQVERMRRIVDAAVAGPPPGAAEEPA